MKINRMQAYPMVPEHGFCSILTTFNLEFHENKVAITKAKIATEYAQSIFSGFDGPEHCLGEIMLLLSDVPTEPLLSTEQARKASVLGLTTLGFVLNDLTHGSVAKRIVQNADGVIILQVTGNLENPQFKINVFDGRETYAKYLATVLEGRDLGKGKNSTLL